MSKKPKTYALKNIVVTINGRRIPVGPSNLTLTLEDVMLEDGALKVGGYTCVLTGTVSLAEPKGDN